MTGVEAIRFKPLRMLPIAFVSVQTIHTDVDVITCFYLVFTDLSILKKMMY